MDAKARTIKLPINLVRNQRKLARAENALALKLDRPPTDAELAAAAVTDRDFDDGKWGMATWPAWSDRLPAG
jgi:DNA-directed RNA polymerase sigma subunit (sigma70/sigma32)